jgi:hypothetical protein
MALQLGNIGSMVQESVTVLTKPAVETFERYERNGGQREAFTYVGAAAAAAAAVAVVFGAIGALVMGSGVAGVAVSGVAGVAVSVISGVAVLVLSLLGFFVYGLLVYHVGKSQGGTGSQDEVFYTLALAAAPILAINGIVSNIPFLGCIAAPATFALSIYQMYLGYLAVRASMNLGQQPAIITVIVAIVAQLVVGAIVGAVVAVAATAVAAAFGGLSYSIGG